MSEADQLREVLSATISAQADVIALLVNELESIQPGAKARVSASLGVTAKKGSRAERLVFEALAKRIKPAR